MIVGFNIPIVLIIYKRPDCLLLQLECLRTIRPTKLYVIADAARNDNLQEMRLVEQTRALVDKIDWPCEIIKIYAKENMGCDPRIVSGLHEVFEQEEMAIILEDDVIPANSFFEYCKEMLLMYRENEEIMYVSGLKKAPKHKMRYSYGFSYDTGMCGWATWRRAWKEWHWDIDEWNRQKKDFLPKSYSKRYRTRYVNNVEKYFTQKDIPWDFIWVFCVGKRLSIFPAVNLIENIGFREDATHTKVECYGYVTEKHELEEIVHPPEIYKDVAYCKAMEKQVTVPIRIKIINKIKRMVGLHS